MTDGFTKPASDRVSGLDTIRGVLALAVFFFHGAMPPVMSGYDVNNNLLRKLYAVFDWSINGQLAVVAFFFISGFCIHYPHVNRPLVPFAFYVNRALRLTLPAIAAIVLTWITHMRRRLQLDGIPL